MRSGNSSSPPSPNVNASGGLPVKTSSAVGAQHVARPAIAGGQDVAMEVHRALRRAGRARRERDQRRCRRPRCRRPRTSAGLRGRAALERMPGCHRRTARRARSVGQLARAVSSSPASRASHSACEISRLATMSVSSFARSSGIVPTAMPPALITREPARGHPSACSVRAAARDCRGRARSSSDQQRARCDSRRRQLGVGPAQRLRREITASDRPSRARARRRAARRPQFSRAG